MGARGMYAICIRRGRGRPPIAETGKILYNILSCVI